jgi:flagellar basal-body rod protein FlgC
MDYHAAFRIGAAGLALEKLKLEVTAANLANMHSAAASADGVYQPLRVLSTEQPLRFAETFGRLAALGGGVQPGQAVPQNVAPRMVHEPGHPYADAKGFVAYPNVNQQAEMMNLTVALRAYEANLTVMNAAKVMATRTLEIGGQQ